MFIIDAPDFDMYNMMNTSQSSHWRRGYGNNYIVVKDNQVVKVKQNGSKLLMSCSEQEFFDTWYNYFDLGNDYGLINEKLSDTCPLLAKCIDVCKGFRLIKRPKQEALLVSIMQNDYKGPWSISVLLDTFCRLCGNMHKNAMGDSGVVTWFETPKCEDVMPNDLKVKMYLGEKLSDKIFSFYDDINELWLDLDTLEFYKENEELFDYVKNYQIDEMLVFGGERNDIIPKDPKVEKMIMLWHDMDIDMFKDWYLDGIEELSSIAYMYIKSAIELKGLKRKWD